MLPKAMVPIVCCALLLQACGSSPTPTIRLAPTASPEPALIVSAEAIPTPTIAPQPTATPQPTVTQQPTSGPTATIWPPVFDFGSLQDIRNLDSFIVTVNEKNTVNGQLTELTNTNGFIKEPYRAYNHNQYSSGIDRTYVIDDRTYELTGSGDWYISAGSSNDFFYRADIPGGNTEKLLEAKFVGQEDYQGIPAYHFVLAAVTSTQAGTDLQIEGDFYLAQAGNYVLYSHWKETSRQQNFTQIYEVTEALSSINQLAEIQLPADMEKMATAAELPGEMALPLPAGSAFSQMIRYQHGIGVDLYFFHTPRISGAEFLDFYRQLSKTDAWQVTHIGHVRLHESDCEFTQECVIIRKGDTQVILYYNGSDIRLEFDWPHLYAPV